MCCDHPSMVIYVYIYIYDSLDPSKSRGALLQLIKPLKRGLKYIPNNMQARMNSYWRHGVVIHPWQLC